MKTKLTAEEALTYIPKVKTYEVSEIVIPDLRVRAFFARFSSCEILATH